MLEELVVLLLLRYNPALTVQVDRLDTLVEEALEVLVREIIDPQVMVYQAQYGLYGLV